MHVCDLHIYAYLPTNISVCIHSVSSELGIIHRSPSLIQYFTGPYLTSLPCLSETFHFNGWTLLLTDLKSACLLAGWLSKTLEDLYHHFQLSFKSSFITSIYSVCAHACGGWRTICGAPSSPCTLWAQGIDLSSLDLAASTVCFCFLFFFFGTGFLCVVLKPVLELTL